MKSLTHKLAKQCGKILRDFAEIPSIIIESCDDALKTFASNKMDAHFDKSDQLAMNDARYAEIEAKRHVPGSDNIIMVNDELTFEDWTYQMDLKRAVLPEPVFMPAYRFLYNRPLNTMIGRTKHAFQRLNRSWDDTATWSLDHHLTLTLGNQLKHLAETTHGWPQSEKYPEFEDWQKALHKNGDYLLAYANKDDVVYTGEGYDMDAEERVFKDAQKALRWVAVNLQGLWD